MGKRGFIVMPSHHIDTKVDSKLLEILLPQIIELSKNAGKEILQVARESVNIESKEDNTPVTNADIAASLLIVNQLSNLDNKFPVLSEESDKVSFNERQSWKTFWLVDPLDGTQEFINNNGEYSINIALIHNTKAVLGVIYAPVQGVTYYAYEGFGAYKVDALKKPEQICVEKKRRIPLIITCGNNTPGSHFEEFVKKVGEVEFHVMGSSLKSCLVADGSADIYARLGPTSEWDTAAAQCIVEEAGGFLTDLSRKPLKYNTKDSLLNPHFLVFGDNNENWESFL
jgi:3'(2'), 5'-bisphosphate nucleotidase